jgi:hypothetical protein
MNALRSFFVAAALSLLAMPVVGQRGPEGIGPVGFTPPGTGILARVDTAAVLVSTTGAAVGKVKTVSAQTAETLFQGLRLSANVTPNTEYVLVIDGNLVGTAVSKSTGVLKMRFLTPENGRIPPLPAAILPIATAQNVAIYEVGSQKLIGSGQFSGSGGPK